MYCCRRCLTGYRTVDALNKHDEYCALHDALKIVLPDPGTKLKFERYCRKMRVPFVIYADFESVIKPKNMCQYNPTQSCTNRYQKHIPISFCFYIKYFDDTRYADCPVEFTAQSEKDDVAQIFMNMLEQKVKEIYNKFLKFTKKMVFTQADAELYAATNTCHICERDICDPAEKVKDHCLLTGKFIGAAHNKCNFKY